MDKDIQKTRHILAWAELKLAIFISAVLILIVATIFFSGLVGSVFQRNFPLVITISDVGGLKVGAPVWLQGVTVGSVKRIDVLSDNQIIVVSVNKKYDQFLYQDAHAEVKAVGLLGSKYVELIRGNKDRGYIKPGQKIKGKLVDPLKSIDQNLNRTIHQLSILLDSINHGSGTASEIIHDKELANDFKGTVDNLRALLEEIRKNPKRFFKVEIF
ncbi:MAG: MCE family protein [Fibrobacter sp.]|nr:MCE family protein [Fibrobacter sp.]